MHIIYKSVREYNTWEEKGTNFTVKEFSEVSKNNKDRS